MLVKKKALLLPKMSPMATAIAVALGAPMAQAATFTVTNNSSGLGAGTLQQAVADAEAAAGDDTIAFDASVTGTIKLLNDLNVTEDLSIDGSGTTGLTVVATNYDYLIQYAGNVSVSAGAALTVSNLDLTTRVDENTNNISLFEVTDSSLTLNNVNLTGTIPYYSNPSENQAVRARNSVVSITDSTVDGFYGIGSGGAIYNSVDAEESGSLSLTGSTVYNNESEDDGGAIFVSNTRGTFTLDVDSTDIFYNDGTDSGGALSISNMGGTVSVNVSGDSSIRDNESNYGGAVFIQGATLAGNIPTTSVVVDSTEIDSNYSDEVSGAIDVRQEDGAFNLSISNSAVSQNGNDEGLSHAEYAYASSGAIAIAALDAAVTVSIDDSEFDENFDAGDINDEGSYEGKWSSNGGALAIAQIGGSLDLNVSGTHFDGNYINNDYEAGGQGGAIGLSAYMTSSTVSISGSDFDDNFSYKDGGAIKAFSYLGSLDTTIDNSEFVNNSSSNYSEDSYGGAIFINSQGADSTLSVNNSIFLGNGQTDNRGGDGGDGYTAGGGAIAVINNAVYLDDDEAFTENSFNLTIANTYFSDNTVASAYVGFPIYGGYSGDGGVLLVSSNIADTNISISNSEFKENTAEYSGGALHISHTKSGVTGLTISDTDFDANRSAENGGAILLSGSGEGDDDLLVSATITGSTFTSNFTTDNGTAIDASAYYSDIDLTLSDNAFQGNYSGISGALAGEQTATGTVNFSSSAGNFGAQSTSFTATGNSFIANYAYEGSALSIANTGGYSSPSLIIANNTFVGNYGERGGVVTVESDYTSAGFSLQLVNNTITANTARYAAGYESAGVDLASDSLKHSEVTIANNIIAGNGHRYAFDYDDGWTINPGDLEIDQDLRGHFTVANNFVGTPNLEGKAGFLLRQGSSNMIGDDDPMLGALADNGGLGRTRYPLTDSPVIDAGNNSFATALGLTLDQRGVDRFQTDSDVLTIDIGAVEVDGDFTPASEVVGHKESKSNGPFGGFNLSFVLAALGMAGLRRKFRRK